MTKRLVTFGCSRAYGHGLLDCFIPKNGPGLVPSKFAWPELLAEKLGLSCVNLSDPGTSNKSIWNRVVNTSLRASDIVMIAWTHSNRWCIFENRDNESAIGPWVSEKFAKVFYKNMFNPVDMNIDFNLRMHHADLYLRNLNVSRYHTINNANDLTRLEWNDSLLLTSTFAPISKHFPRALDNHHPGEEAHRVYAQQLYKEITENQ